MVRQNTVRQGSGVYCGGIAITVISMALVVVRRNGFRATNMTLGDTIQHRGVDVWFSRKALVIGGGKAVHVYTPFNDESCERYTITNGERRTHGAIQQLIGGHGFRYINGKVAFGELPTSKDGCSHDDIKHGEFWGCVVCKAGTRRPIGHYEW